MKSKFIDFTQKRGMIESIYNILKTVCYIERTSHIFLVREGDGTALNSAGLDVNGGSADINGHNAYAHSGSVAANSAGVEANIMYSCLIFNRSLLSRALAQRTLNAMLNIPDLSQTGSQVFLSTPSWRNYQHFQLI